VVTNAVGGDTSEVKVEVHKVQLQPGDMVLLCSDGLTNMVSEQEIHRTLLAQPDPERACRQLLQSANDAGGKDNITIIIARFEQVER
jgi:protein phosphatase